MFCCRCVSLHTQETMSSQHLLHPQQEYSSSSSSSPFSSANSDSLRERKLQCHAADTRSELNTLHPATLSESEAEEFVLAFIKETNPLYYVGSLLKSWCKGQSAKASSSSIKDGVSLNSPSLKTSQHTTSRQFHLSWQAICSIILLKFLLIFARAFEIIGNAIEYHLNLVHMNHGFKNTLQRFLFNRDAVRKPSNEDDDYFSITMLIDPRQELQLQEGVLSDMSLLDSDVGVKNLADVCVMASKLAYENKNVIKRVVEDVWKMNFVQFLDCWNDYLEYNSTQGFIFTDKRQDANIVIVAFRGTQVFNLYDWCTDLDFSYYMLPEIGRVHVGFLEALGLGSRLKRETLKQAKINTFMKANKLTPSSTPSSGLSEEVQNDGGKVLAYDAICSKLRTLLRQNLGARLYVTGHSLGGALAIVFSALLMIEDNIASSSLGGTFTFGQPRVGDAKFASYMEKQFCGMRRPKYFRVVYRTDFVPRLPWDDRVFQFKHISPCHFYMGSSTSMALLEEPYKDLLLAMLQPMVHVSAIRELLLSLKERLMGRGGGYVETNLAVAMRFFALICPWLCAHLPSCYVDAVRGAPSSFLLEAVIFEKRTWRSCVTSFIWSIFGR